MFKRFLKIGFISTLLIASLSGCGGQYKIERDFWLTYRKYNRLLQKIDRAEEKDYQQMIVDLRRLTVNYPFLDRAAEAQLDIANLYHLQNKLDNALAEYKKVIDDYPNVHDACARAMFAIGSIYQVKGEEARAAEYFKKAVRDYPGTRTALGTPLYLGRYYEIEERPEEAEVAYSEALAYYKSIIDKHPNGAQGISAIDYLVSCYVDKGRWQEAVDSLSEIADKHPQAHVGQKALFNMARIYEVHFEDELRADQIYEKIVDRFPDSPLSELIKKYFQLREQENESAKEEY
jgi:tetratricopeptide (TPR) repeat protein